MICDMCGTDAERLFKTSLEGSELNVCGGCSKHGRVISEIKIRELKPRKTKEEIKKQSPDKEFVFMIVSDYAEMIKKGREALGLKQEDFAKKINEKHALIHKIETGHFKPGIELARKLEKILKIRLVEQQEEVNEQPAKGKTDAFTIGDFIKIKK